MEVFEPQTFSTDWEIMVFDHQERCVNTPKLAGIAGAMRSALDLPIQIDWNAIELALGVNHSFDQILGRAIAATDRLSALLAEYQVDACPAGSHPVEVMFNASHVHVGTLTDESAGLRLEADMIAHVPAFAALAANSPFSDGRGPEYKSHRIRLNAHRCTFANAVHDPNLSQDHWGMDAGPKMAGAATFEVRALDCASSRRFVAELATFVAAYVHYRSRHISDGPPTPAAYERSCVNRWLAAKHGLQATFLTEGGSRPVVEILAEMLAECHGELARLGANAKDLVLINRMLEKRTTQADYLIELGSRYSDPYVLSSVMIKTLRHWDTFDNYLDRAPVLDPIAAPTRNDILDAHLAMIGEGSHYYSSRRTMSLPPPAADAVVAELVEKGLLRIDYDANGGKLLTRV